MTQQPAPSTSVPEEAFAAVRAPFARRQVHLACIALETAVEMAQHAGVDVELVVDTIRGKPPAVLPTFRDPNTSKP